MIAASHRPIFHFQPFLIHPHLRSAGIETGTGTGIGTRIGIGIGIETGKAIGEGERLRQVLLQSPTTNYAAISATVST